MLLAFRISNSMLISRASAHEHPGRIFETKAGKEHKEEDYLFSKTAKAKAAKSVSTKAFKAAKEPEKTSVSDGDTTTSGGGLNSVPTSIAGFDNSIRLLRREGK